MTNTLFMIHGMLGGGWYWGNYRQFFEARGFNCITPTLPCHDMAPGDPPDSRLGTLGLLDYADDLEQAVRALDETPILVGHSMGGLLAQILASRDAAKALVLLAPAPPRGILALQPAIVRGFRSALVRRGFWKKPFRLTFDETAWLVLNRLSRAEQESVYRQLVYESGRALCEIGFWFLDSGAASRVDAAQVTCPVRVICGEQDRITPPAVARRIAGKYGRVSSYRELAGHGHWLVGEPGWETICEDISAWLNSLVAA